MDSPKLGRRQLLKGIGGVVAWASLAACAPKVVKEVVKETVVVEGTPKIVEKVVEQTKIVEKVVTQVVTRVVERKSISINHFGGSSKELSDKHHLWSMLRERFPDIDLVNNWISYNGWKEKIPVMVASGDISDMQITHYTNNVPTMMEGGLIAETGPLLEQYGQNILAATPEVAWIGSVYDGKQYAAVHDIYDLNIFLPGYRSDWLDAAGLPTPTTIDEFREALRVFTVSDLDKSGKPDTWGRLLYTNLTADEDIFNAFGVGAGTFHEGVWRQRGDQIALDWVQPGMKEALAWMRDVWADGLFHPDSITIPLGQRLVTYDAGTTGQAHVEWTAHDRQNVTFGQLGADARQALGQPVKGPQGEQGVTGRGYPWGYVVSKKSKYPAEVIQVLDYIYSPEVAHTLLCAGVLGITNKGLNEKGWVEEYTTEEQVAMGDAWTKKTEEANGIGFWTGIHDGALRPWLLKAFPDDMREHYEGVLARRYSEEALEGMDWCLEHTIDTLKARPVPSDNKYWGTLQTAFAEFISQAVSGTILLDQGWDEWLVFAESNGLPEITEEANAI
jgi:ABC-type glycerol-3-phosphate transport system substrate-binding protein